MGGMSTKEREERHARRGIDEDERVYSTSTEVYPGVYTDRCK